MSVVLPVLSDFFNYRYYSGQSHRVGSSAGHPRLPHPISRASFLSGDSPRPFVGIKSSHSLTCGVFHYLVPMSKYTNT